MIINDWTQDSTIITLNKTEVTLLLDALDVYISESPYVDGEIAAKNLADDFCSLTDKMGIL
jgi:hypothetical protein